MDSTYTFRFAHEGDIPLLLTMIGELAEFVQGKDEVVATPDSLRQNLFEHKAAEAIVIEHIDEGPIGYAVFYRTFSTWTGGCGMFLEDLYLRPAHRGAGIGKAMMGMLAGMCVDRGWVRFEWECRDWNETALGFYEHLGARRLQGGIYHRLSGAALDKLAQEA